MRRLPLAVAIALSIACAVQAQPAPRTELPIREVVMSNGARRYAVTLKVAGQHVVAGLDTGSTGLRLMPKAGFPEPAEARSARPYSFGAGVRLEGVIARQPVQFGEAAGEAWVQHVRRIDCTAARPDCPAKKLPVGEFGIQGDGLKGQGFAALLGINTGPSDAENPLQAAGVQRWIIELPRPGDRRPGRLILNPTEPEIEGYAFASTMRLQHSLHDAVAGCLVNRENNDQVCGAMLFDTGAPGLKVKTAEPQQQPWRDGSPAALVLIQDGKPAAVAALQLGRREHASRLEFDATPGRTVIYAGLTPYFAFSVLYDPVEERIGVKPLPPTGNSPVGSLKK